MEFLSSLASDVISRGNQWSRRQMSAVSLTVPLRLISNIQKNTRKNYQLLENGGECQDILTRDVESCQSLKIVSEPTSNL